MSNQQQQEFAIQQLSDVFSGESNERLRSLCEQHNWNVQSCVDHLINGEKDDSSPTEEQRSEWRFSAGAIRKENGIIQRTEKSNTQAYEIEKKIKAGFRIMVIMRGAPGSGKSYLAKTLLERCMLPNECFNKLNEFIFSSDDYFYDHAGRYKYSVDRLEEAHDYNQRRVREKAAAGWSPLFIDNTNMKLWEMLPYVKIAVRHGYLVELLEPKTPWCVSAGKLAQRNQHRVPREKIQIMLNKYENGNVADLMKMLTETKYTVPMPQLRLHPPINVSSHPTADIDEKLKNLHIQTVENKPPLEKISLSGFEATSKPLNGFVTNAPKEQRERLRSKNTSKLLQPAEDEESVQLLEPSKPLNIWKPYELDGKNAWAVSDKSDAPTTPIAPDTSDPPRADKTLLDLLKEGVNEVQSSLNTKIIMQSSPPQKIKFQRHSVNCRNELPVFASLRQIYPNKEVVGLWDLFVKCNGDIDWAVDILLKEDELSFGDDLSFTEKQDDSFECGCSDESKETIDTMEDTIFESSTTQELPESVPKKKRSRFHRKQRTNAERQEVQDTVANRIVLGDEFYSKQLRKQRDIRSGHTNSEPKLLESVETQTESLDDEQDEVENELLELAIGADLVQQLTDIFKSETILSEQLPRNMPINAFIPRELAKEIYMLCVESVYNQIEEKRQQTLREDENFARLLKNPKYENIKDSPDNVQELLDVEMAWSLYNSEENKDTSEESSADSITLATHLTRMKLCETFPDIPRDTLLDILEVHGGRFNETVNVLRSTMTSNDQSDTQLLESTTNNKSDLQTNEKLPQQHKSGIFSTHSSDSNVSVQSSIQPEEMKRLALSSFEQTRNLATHHSQLKAECYQKAKAAIHKGHCAVAVYYSEIANMHKVKIEDYNHRAANCIMDVHRYNQNNPDLLDLHYLFLAEAASCLDLFVDRHITGLRHTSRVYKHVFIITGRGLHSTGGVATIKNKVKSRLKERNLRWTEINPGLLKVKIFSASRHSKNF